jgi:hypothetical protein
MDDLRYPVGRFQVVRTLSPEQRRTAIDTIAAAPGHMRTAVHGLDQRQLDTPYRPDGWSVRQVVHHVPDSHVNAYVRTKLALTEDNPHIKAYDEKAWAGLEDSRTTPIDASLMLLDALHDRWVRLFRAMTPADFTRTLMHSENGEMTLDHVLAMYQWHSLHHVAHIARLRSRNNW